MNLVFCLLFMFYSGLLAFSLNRKHLLVTLFSLEYLVLIVFLTMYFFMLSLNYEMYFMMIFLVFTVCEGALGLSVLVNMIRSHGNDLLSSLSVLSW
uniref:NADH-ubiquinone oxidoreductase chain 4L n=1 Tax=Helcomeria spinosa TaxID=2813414 RepID=A0A8T9ZX96_9HEMI|nr:NADH dehydrogenase subunit 4L [Helcomeria spinosa]